MRAVRWSLAATVLTALVLSVTSRWPSEELTEPSGIAYDDGDPSVSPGAPEIQELVDNDRDGQVDEGT
jgi:hypothetical protein